MSNSHYERDSKAPIIGISRHRLKTDGEGVTTLVAFHGCPLHCKYCINPQCKIAEGIKESLSPIQLYNKVKIDDLYFLVTGGGIVFGGGEPLLYSNFIVDFSKICDNKWKFSVETSLNVNCEFIRSLEDIIDCWIIDIKDWNEDIYFRYTGANNKIVKENLQYLISRGLKERIIVRVPNIPSFNTEADIANTVIALKSLGVKYIDRFGYKVNTQTVWKKRKEYAINNGKFKCEVLKSIRIHVAECNHIQYHPHKCEHVVCSTGCCPTCDKELNWLTKQYYNRNNK